MNFAAMAGSDSWPSGYRERSLLNFIRKTSYLTCGTYPKPGRAKPLSRTCPSAAMKSTEAWRRPDLVSQRDSSEHSVQFESSHQDDGNLKSERRNTS